jgi:hypothetical protein
VNTHDPKERKVIPVVNIKKIAYPAIDEGIKKFMTNIVSNNFCVIHYVVQGADKVMELGCHNPKFMSKFAEQMA